MLRSRRRAFSQRTSSLPKESVHFHWKDYAGSTSIHGVKYVAEPKRPFVERIWWILFLGACLTGNVMLTRKMWDKYNQVPPAPVPTYDIPFPALTICNEMKAKKSFFDRLNQTEEGSEQLDGLNNVLGVMDIDYGTAILENQTIEYYFNRSDMANFLTQATPSVDEMMESCDFGTNRLNPVLTDPELRMPAKCSQLFSKVFTYSGVCYTFNALSSKELFRSKVNHCNQDHGRHSSWTAERGYNEDEFDYDLSPPVYPHRTYSGGRLFGMSLELKTLRSDIMLSRYGATMAGFKVQLHSPEDFPQVDDTSILVPLNTHVTIMVSPKVTSTVEGLRSYSPKERGCYYQNEKLLKYFEVYTYDNCKFECLVNVTYESNECVAFYMPKDDTMAVCHHSQIMWILEAEVMVNEKDVSDTCQCLPSCFSVEYDFKIRQNEYRSKTWSRLNQTGHDVSKLEFFFEKPVFQPIVRREVVDLVDFLASCGGLLGLFSGMSIISFGEIVYYLTFRLWANVQLVKKCTSSTEHPLESSQRSTAESLRTTNTQSTQVDPQLINLIIK